MPVGGETAMPKAKAKGKPKRVDFGSFITGNERVQSAVELGRRLAATLVPVLIHGEPGTGKTAIVEGLALRMVEGDVPPILKDCRLISLDMGLLQAGAGVKGGVSYGESDEVGYKAAVNKMHVNDLHATILHLMGIDHELLTYNFNGRDFRLTDVAGEIIHEVLA